MRPRLLDLFCGAGGASVGYHRWTDEWDELREAIPPAYTEFVGAALLAHIATQGEGSTLAASEGRV